jgi:nucleoside-diphosphate-sugar epimerase
MRVVVFGATGNVGTSLLPALAADERVTSIVGVARRPPSSWWAPEVEWIGADVAIDPLESIVAGADAFVHLSWLIQPSHDVRAMWATNVVGTRRVADAVARTKTGVLVAASSIGAYSPAPSGETVDETWPTDGTPESSYSWQKALEERTLDVLESRHSECRVVRMRPALIFKREAARHVRNLFIGKLMPQRLLPVDAVVAAVMRLPIAFQVVHADDVASAIVRAIMSDTRGAFNLAAPGVIGRVSDAGRELARLARPLVGAAWRARLVPVDPGWLTLATSVPLMSTDRARDELGWTPTMAAAAVLRELLDGLRHDAAAPTPPLAEKRLDDDATTEPAVVTTAI